MESTSVDARAGTGWDAPRRFTSRARREPVQNPNSPSPDDVETARIERHARDRLDTMTREEKVGQLVVPVIFPSSPDDLRVTPELRALLRDGHIGGYFITAGGAGADRVRAFTAELQAAARLPLLLASDFEGGAWNYLRSAVGPRPSAAEIGASGDPAQARAHGAEDGRLLASLGLNLTFAPVVDVLTNPANPVLRDRCFGADADLVARMAAAYLDGLASAGVPGCLKHFPGLGAATADPHHSLPTVGWSRAELERFGLAPYRALLASARSPMVMTAHVLLPAIDPNWPASLSPTAIHGLLRKELGYDGPVISDSLAMGALTASYPVPVSAVYALKAGADLLLGAPTIRDAWRTIALLTSALDSGELSPDRLDAAVLRALRFKLRWRILAPDAVGVPV